MAAKDGKTGSTSLTVTAATLVSIGVTPADPSIADGTAQQFTATGVYSDASTQDLTAQVTWSSPNDGCAAHRRSTSPPPYPDTPTMPIRCAMRSRG